MIVKNEQDNLSRCLNSVKGCVEEIIIVDTGSHDNTIAIAEEHGAKIFYYPWDDDFASARNFSLKKATGDWILYLDADEELEQNCCARLKKLESLPGIEGYIFQINNLSDTNDPLRHINLRMFRNRPEYRFEGKLHEQITHIITSYNFGTVVNSGINIFHYGYLSSQLLTKDKISRNYRINKKLVDSEPNNPFYLYTLGGTCINLKDYAGAAECYERSLDNVDPMAIYAPSIYISYISCLLAMGRLKEAYGKIADCKKQFPDYVDIHFIEGEFFQKIGLPKKAIKSFKKCLEFGEQTNGKYTTRTGVGTFLPLFELAQIHKTLGDVNQAAHYQAQGLKLKNYAINELVRYCQFLGELSLDISKVQESLCKLLENLENPRRSLIISQVLYELKEYNLALSELINLPDSNDTAYIKGLCMARLGKINHVLKVFDYIQDTALDTFILDVLISCWCTNSPMAASEFLQGIKHPDQEFLTTLRSFNDSLLTRSTNKIDISHPTVTKLIGGLLTQKCWAPVIDILNLSGLDTALSKVAYLSNHQPGRDKLELAARLSLQELKNGQAKPDYFYVLGWYFVNHDALTEAHLMVNNALAILPDAVHFRKLLLMIYRKQALKIIQSALENHPDNQMFLDQLLDLQKDLLTATGLKGGH
ncbi:glycosyltransferase [Desulforamulus aquiferis]|uniref:Glycosyltransferase n=2 Tax=Desulforamulus aquiferis TaxID=1397668 RepID=A0AAW7ZFR7_9FIRM|nr:glycosyltransferase [Desulforamulus aquiferis]